MTKIASKWSNGSPNGQWNSRRYDDDKLDNIQVNSLNVNTYTSEIIAIATTGFTITPAMTVDNDIFFVDQTGADTDIIYLSDDFPVGTIIHLFAVDLFNLRTETDSDKINNVASKGWAVPAADDIVHCFKSHSDNWHCTEETKAGLDVVVLAATAV